MLVAVGLALEDLEMNNEERLSGCVLFADEHNRMGLVGSRKGFKLAYRRLLANCKGNLWRLHTLRPTR